MSIFDQAMEELTRTRISVMTKSVFYTVVMLGLKYEITEDVPTAGVDGVTAFFNPHYFLKQSEDRKLGLLMHELSHLTYRHSARRGDRTRHRYNVAGDISIDNDLTDMGYDVPDIIKLDPKYLQMSTEEIYKELPEDIEIEMRFMDIMPAPKGMDQEQVDAQISQLIVQAQAVHEMSNKGQKLPGEVTRAIQELLQPRLDPRVLMQKYMTDIAKDNYSWNRPNKRFAPDLYLPSRHSPTIDHLVTAFDISGSVDDDELREYLTEVEYFRKIFNLKKLTIIGCDDQIREVYNVKPNQNLLNLKFGGGGCTDFAPVFEYLKKKRPTVLLYYTDMCSGFDFEVPRFDTIWINTYSSQIAPFGKTVILR